MTEIARAELTMQKRVAAAQARRISAEDAARWGLINEVVPDGTVLDAVKQAGDAITSVQSLQRQHVLQQEALAKAERAYDFAVQRYQAGLGNQISVLNTESQLIAQRRLAVDLQARALDTRIALATALGGGWSDDTPQLQPRPH
jgi:outer membrane protein TolC